MRSLELFDLVRGRRKNQAWKVWLTKVWSSFSWQGLGTIEAGRTDKRERGSLEADRARRRAFLHFQKGEGKFERPLWDQEDEEIFCSKRPKSKQEDEDEAATSVRKIGNTFGI